MTWSKYAPVVEPSRKKSRKGEGKTPPGFNKRFPGGGFAARMKAAEKRWELLKIEKSGGRNAASHQKGKKVASKKMCALRGDLKVKKEKTDDAARVDTNRVGRSLRDHKDVEEDIIEDFDSQELLENGIEGETKPEVETAKKGVVQGRSSEWKYVLLIVTYLQKQVQVRTLLWKDYLLLMSLRRRRGGTPLLTCSATSRPPSERSHRTV